MISLSSKWHLERYNNTREEEWDYFIDKSSLNSTFLHSRRFLNHNPLNNSDDFSFMFFKKGKIAACIPAILIETKGRKVWNSHFRLTYGGLIVSKGVGIEDVMEITRLIENEMITNRIDEAIVRNTFRVFNRKFCDEFDYSLWKTGFMLKSREIELGISLIDMKYSDIVDQYENGNKYNIKKALKTVEIKFSDDFLSFWNLLEMNLLKRHNQRPVHDFETITRLKNLLKDGEVKLVAAFEKDIMIGGIILFNFMDLYLHAQYIASSFDHQHIRPVNALINYVIKWACENNYHYFNLGTPNEENGNIVNFGLSYFKEGFGCRSCLRETMHKLYLYD